MTLSFPREMPFTPQLESTFELDPGTVTARHARGRAGTTMRVREPVWIAKYESEPVDLATRAEWQAWANSLRGGLRMFLGWDVTRHQPFAYPNGVPSILDSSWDGTATVEDLSTPGSIAVSGAPANFALRPGDRVGLVENGIHGYFEVVEPVNADGSGDMAIAVEPLVPAGLFTTAATAVLYRPRCKMVIVNGSFRCPGVAGLASVSFQAAQVLV